MPARRPYWKGYFELSLVPCPVVLHPATSQSEKTRVPKEMVELASHILESKAGKFDLSSLKDEYELGLRKLVKRKASGKTIERAEPAENRSNVIDLMVALRQSVSGSKSASEGKSGKKGQRARPGPSAVARADKKGAL